MSMSVSSPTHASRTLFEKGMVVVFLASTLFYYPFKLLPPLPSLPMAASARLFTTGMIGALALAFCLFQYHKIIDLFRRRIWLGLGCAVIAVVVFVHFSLNNVQTLEGMCFALTWIAIPLFVCVNAEFFAVCVPYYLTTIWLLNCVDCSSQRWLGAEMTGLSGNRNWTGDILVSTTPFVAYLAYYYSFKLFRKRVVSWGIAGVLVGLSAYFLFYAFSRGAWLSLGGAAFALLLFYLQGKQKYAFIIGSVVIGMVAAAFLLMRGTDFLGIIISKDVRVSLWESALRLIFSHPLIGVGIESFESCFAPFRSVEYFLCQHSAVRTNHPHNHLLFFAASYGVPGFICWFLLLVYPVMHFLIHLRRNNSLRDVLICGAFLMMLIHAFFDLIFFEWPGNCVGMILLGVLWWKCWLCDCEDDEKENGRRIMPLMKWLAPATGGALLICVCLMALQEWKASVAFRTALIHLNFLSDHESAIYFFDKAAAAKPQARSIYKAAVKSLTKLDNPDLALNYFRQLDERTPYKNYAHNHGFTGIAFLKKNKLAEARDALLQEVDNFPILTGAWFNLYRVNEMLGNKKEAEIALERVMLTLKVKKIPENKLNLLLRNPEYDMHPNLIPKEELN